MKNVVYLTLTLFLASLLIDCKDTTSGFSPGAGDPRITGTWRLVERRFQKDSVQIIDRDTVITRRDTGTIYRDGKAIKFDTLNKSKTTYRTTRNLTIDTTLYYSATPPQTITFNSDGQLSVDGSQMTYYTATKYYRVDATYPDSLFLKLYINTNRANVAFQQGLKIQGDMLTLLPFCDPCYSKFIRVK